jgi:hypothetical protein
MLGSTAQAIVGRINRGTLPRFDGFDERGRGYWYEGTLRSVLHKVVK